MSVLISDEQDIPIRKRQLAHHLSSCLKKAGCADMEVSVLLTSDRHICELNSRFRKIRKPTDVLSFSMEEGEGPLWGNVLGDIIISVETAARQAKEMDRTVQEEVEFLAIHGLLHLLGHDHESDGWESWNQALKEIQPHE